MSRLCAKPVCAEPAVVWLDVLREQRRVVEHVQRSPHGLPLCGAHRDRFVVPAGWVFERYHQPVVGAAVVVDGAETITEEHPPNAVLGVLEEITKPDVQAAKAERPWFLADVPESVVSARPLLPAGDDDDNAQPSLGSGSLLRRAFHGPDRDDDALRRSVETASESPDDRDARYTLETERAADALDIYGTAQLPFPPVDAEAQAAVS